MKKLFKKYILYFLLVITGIFFITLLFTGKINSHVSDFFDGVENRTFDMRQEITSAKREPSKDIIIVTIDDNTYEYILEKYGDWPMPRYIYSDIVNYIESQKPKIVAFDLIFSKSMKSVNNDDERLAELFKKYDNLYTAIHFDDMNSELRAPELLDEKLTVNLDNRINTDVYSAPNRKPVLRQIISNTKNIGHVNFQRAKDGVIRDIIPFVYYEYQKAYFPHLALKVAQKQLGSETRNFVIDKDMNLNFDGKIYPINEKGTMFLNWYKKKEIDDEDTVIYENISMSEVINAINLHKEGKPSRIDNVFKDKIVYIGATAVGMGDIKTVPVEKFMAGVELHTTFINNMIDNSFIRKISLENDLYMTLLLCLMLTFIMLKVEYSAINYKYVVPINSAIMITYLILFYLFSIWIMSAHNIWIPVVMPTVGIISTFIIVYIIRYFYKSQDYEYTYRLATTDGLTGLYNHRFFQEKMIETVENNKKSGKKFSLILTDIDFFKKFNDTYGHQAGDTVLRQVARMLKKHVKRTDYVCRYGGEEMSVILLNADKEKAMKVAERLCKAVSSNICKLSEDLEVNVTISLGVSTYPDNGNTPTELIEYSDRGLYAAKENGRNQVGIID